MEWEKMLEEYFAMLESFSGMALFEEAVRMEEEMAGWEAERMREVGDEKERMRLGSGEGMEESWGAVFGGGMDWMEGDGVSVSGDAEMEEEVRRMERVSEMAAAVSRETAAAISDTLSIRLTSSSISASPLTETPSPSIQSIPPPNTAPQDSSIPSPLPNRILSFSSPTSRIRSASHPAISSSIRTASSNNAIPENDSSIAKYSSSIFSHSIIKPPSVDDIRLPAV